MSIWFPLCVIGLFVATFFHFKSVEHIKFQSKYGRDKGIKICRIYGTISGTMESIILVGLWVSPQPTFIIPMFSNLVFSIGNLSVSILHLVISLPLTLVGTWFGIEGLRAVGMKVAETHSSPEKIVTTGVYSVVRHPQYFGWMLAHIGMSVLFSDFYSVLFTPVLSAIIYLISRKEEEELIREFGKDYEEYKKNVPMFFPSFHKH